MKLVDVPVVAEVAGERYFLEELKINLLPIVILFYI
jgi:hypothetical protein